MAVQRIGKYQITAEIGSGGFGHVYSAQDPSVGRVVAIKVMNAPGDTDLVRRFRAEAMTVAMLAHKNIVTVHDYGEQDGAPYLVMEYLEGVNLQDLIKQGSLSLLEKVEIMIEVAEGLHCAHKQGITHRDVKPANIMRLADGSVKIMDFGIARIASESANRLTQTGFIVGTWSYMAPEQFNGTSDAQSDIFAYGVTFYELLTGRNPFAAADPAGVFSRITTVDPPPISSLLTGCPEDLDRLIQKTLEKDREQRYANLQDLVVDAKPILFDLRRSEAVHVFNKASQLLDSGQLDASQTAVRKTLELDPTHAGARKLRTQIEKEMQRRDSAAKAGTLLEKAEKELREHQFQEALSTLAAVRPFVPGDSPLHTRLMRADAAIENAKRVVKLLDSARDNLRRLDYTEAFKSVTEALATDPGNNTGKALLQEIRTGMTLQEAKRRMHEEVARAEGLLLTGETEQALALLQELERNHPASPEVAALRRRADAQWAEENRRLKVSKGVADCKALIRNQQFDEAAAQANRLLADFPDNTELQNLLRHATDRLAAKKRSEQIARLKTEAAAYVSRQEFDFAIKLLETGVAKLGDDGELTRLLQSAISGKEALEREQGLAQTTEQVRLLRRQGKFDEALNEVERAIQVWGDSPQMQGALGEIAAERRAAALREILRRATATLEQGNPDAAAAGLRECLKRHGEDQEIRRLLETAEGRIRERDQGQRTKSILDSARQLASVRRWQEALQCVDDGLRQLPGNAALATERKNLAAAMEAERSEQERAQREQERIQREQERIQREQEKARRDQENAQREREKQELAKTVREVQSARERGLSDEATVILNAAFVKHGKAEQLLQEQQRIAQGAAERQRVEAIEKSCAEARALQKLSQFDEALRALDGAEVRYPGAAAIAALRTEVEKDRAAFRRKKEIEDALAKASEMVQKGQTQAAFALLDDALRSHPESRELKDAAARLKTRLEEEERQNEIMSVTGAIKMAIDAGDMNRAVNMATGAFAKFPDPKIENLKRKAEEGKQRKDFEEAEAGIAKARAAGNLDLAAELATAARIRWEREKRFQKLEEEIAEARAEKSMATAKTHSDAGKFDEAERMARLALKQRPNLASATDMLASIAARREAQKQRRKQEADSKPVAVVPAESAGGRRKFVAIAVAAGLLMAAGIVWKLFLQSPAPAPPPQEQTAAAKLPAQPSATEVKLPPAQSAASSTSSISVSNPLSNSQAVRGQDYSETLHASGASAVTWTIEGSLPPGLIVDKNSGRIHGRTNAAKRVYSFVAIATDSSGGKGQAGLSISVVDPASPSVAAVPGGPKSPAVAPAETNTGAGKSQTATPAEPKPEPKNPPAAAPPPPQPTALPQCKPFNLATWGDLKKGKFTWTGRLVNGQATLNASQARGDYPVPGVPVKFISISPDVGTMSGPDRANCWSAPLTLKGSGPDSSFTVIINWQLFQPDK